MGDKINIFFFYNERSMRDTNEDGQVEDAIEGEMGAQPKEAKRVSPNPRGTNSLEQVEMGAN